MLKPSFRTLLLLALCVLSGAARSQAHAAESRDGTIPFVILHTNDIHGQIRALPDPRSRAASPPLAGGIQELVAAIDEERGRVTHSVLVDAGDWYQGTPEGTLSEGLCAVELMNAAGFDLATLGNHEFDCGQDALARLLDAARFQVIGRNLLLRPGPVSAAETQRTASPLLATHIASIQRTPPRVFVVGGFRVAFDGLLPEETPRVTTEQTTGGLVFASEVETARGIRQAASSAGIRADALVLVNHIGKDRNVVIAREVPGIDVIIGGHAHRDVLEQGVVVPSSGTLIAQAAPATTALGIVTLRIDPRGRRIVSKSARLRRITPDPTIAAGRMKPIIDRYEAAVEEVMGVRVADVPAMLTKEGDLENPSALGAWLTQVMLDASGADVAVHNMGGIRAAIPAGVARVRELFQVSPFGNRLVVVSMTADDLLALAERTAANPSRGCVFRGIEIAWRPGQDAKPVVLGISRGGRELAADEILRVVTTDFLAGGSDGMSPFKNATGRTDLGVSLLDATVDAARTARTIAAPAGNAWRKCEEPK
jgi:5'-nucleotidase / UDP-sugar diphosphatase